MKLSIITDKKNNFCVSSLESMAEVVEAMHYIVKSLNDETAYFEHWIDLVPDEASWEDFLDIAADEEFLSDVIERFKYIIKKFID